MIEELIHRATTLVWLDYGWEDTEKMLRLRCPKSGENEAEFAKLMLWAEHYWTRDSSSSYTGHQALFNGFKGIRVRLGGTQALEEFMNSNPVGSPRASPDWTEEKA